MTKKYQVRFPAPGKKKQIFTVKAKSLMDAWKIGAGKYTGKHGNKHYINTLYPSFTEIKENEYKGIAHTIRDIMENGFGEPKTIDLVYEPEEEYLEEALNQPRLCPCGSGKMSWWESDAKGIPLARVCEKCFPQKMKKFRPEVLTNPAYKQTEDDDDWKNQDGAFAPWEKDLYEHDYIEERRKGPTSGLTRQKQRLGALKAKRSRSVGGIKKFPKKRPLEEMVRADQPPDKAVTKYDPENRRFIVIPRNGRRKIIDLKNSDPKVPRKFEGYRNYVNSWTGEQYNN